MEVTTRIIAVGVDESEGAAHALRWAVAEGAVHGASVRAVLAWTYLDQPARPGQDRVFDAGYSDEAAAAVLRDILRERLGDGADAVEAVVVNDHAGPGLVDHSADADLLVVGARGLGMVRAAVLGSISGYCLHHAKVPVAVIGEHTAEDRADELGAGPVVVGTDGSDAAAPALAWAAAEARARGAELKVLVAWSLPATGAVPLLDLKPFEAAAEEVLATAIASAKEAGVEHVSGAAPLGGAGQVLIEATREAAVTVVGSRGRGGFRALLLGSTSQQLAAHAEGPVVVVPTGRDRES